MGPSFPPSMRFSSATGPLGPSFSSTSPIPRSGDDDDDDDDDTTTCSRIQGGIAKGNDGCHSALDFFRHHGEARRWTEECVLHPTTTTTFPSPPSLPRLHSQYIPPPSLPQFLIGIPPQKPWPLADMTLRPVAPRRQTAISHGVVSLD
jgi:hypothetical protein